jgi:hypothetical protein
VVAGKLHDDRIEMIRGNSGLYMRSDHIQSSGRELPSFAHASKTVRPMQLNGVIALERPGDFNIRHGI